MSEKKKKGETLAVIEVGGQQFLVREGEEFLVDKLSQKTLTLTPYLVITPTKIEVGTPEVKGYKCKLEVLEPEVKGEKKIVFKYRPKTGYHRKKGARPIYSLVKVTSIAKK